MSGVNIPDSKVHGANMGPTWVLSAPDGSHVGPKNLAIGDITDGLPSPRASNAEIAGMAWCLHMPRCEFGCQISTLNPVQWRHNERDDVTNHWHLDCLLNRLLRRRSKKTSKLCVTGLTDAYVIARHIVGHIDHCQQNTFHIINLLTPWDMWMQS